MPKELNSYLYQSVVSLNVLSFNVTISKNLSMTLSEELLYRCEIQVEQELRKLWS